MRDVSGASSSSNKSSTSRYACFAAMAVVFFFLLSLSGGNNNSSGESVRSGQAKRPTVHNEGSKAPAKKVVVEDKESIGTKYETATNESSGGSKPEPEPREEIDEEEIVEEAESEFRKAIQEQLASNQPRLKAAIGTIMGSVRSSLDTLLGDGDLFEKEEIEMLGNRMEDRLQSDVDTELQTKTDALLEEDVEEMENDADLDTEGEATPGEDPVNLEDEEKKLVVGLRDGVDDICAEVEMKLKHMAALVQKELLEAALKEKTGSTYEVTIDESDNVTGYKKKSTPAASSSSHSSSSSGHKSSSSSHNKSSSSGHKSSHHSSSSHNKHSSSGHKSSSSHHKSSSSHHKTTKKSGGDS